MFTLLKDMQSLKMIDGPVGYSCSLQICLPTGVADVQLYATKDIPAEDYYSLADYLSTY